mmetsp:Transcript_9792/g.18959  ORF Transcript_9792/g.18959 Transcript_9792/m.18959 type:complete len:200 (+) Transcript_9792:365-964(+)
MPRKSSLAFMTDSESCSSREPHKTPASANRCFTSSELSVQRTSSATLLVVRTTAPGIMRTTRCKTSGLRARLVPAAAAGRLGPGGRGGAGRNSRASEGLTTPVRTDRGMSGLEFAHLAEVCICSIKSSVLCRVVCTRCCTAIRRCNSSSMWPWLDGSWQSIAEISRSCRSTTFSWSCRHSRRDAICSCCSASLSSAGCP